MIVKSASYKLAVAVMVINKEKKLLLVQGRKRGWGVPGGYVSKKESVKNAAIREIKEEAGIHIQITKFCGIHRDSEKMSCVFLFIGIPIGGSLSLGDGENLDAGYFTIEEALSKITNKHDKERIIRFLKKKETPMIIET